MDSIESSKLKVQKDSSERLYGADFVRVWATFTIILYHAFVQLYLFNIGKYPCIRFANGDFGFRATTIFFILSGAMLCYSNSDIDFNFQKISEFYKKRWLSIFPAFYIVWIFEYVRRVLVNRNFFYNGNPLTVIMSFFGVDGYFNYAFQNYYIVGEWFLGAIIIIYLLFPIINACFRKNPHITLAVAALSSYLPLGLSFWKIQTDKNIFICLFSFIFGMWYIKYRSKLANKVTITIVIVLDILLLKIHISDCYYIRLFSGFIAFIGLYELGTYIMKKDKIKKMVGFLSGISYEIFLVHHLIIYKIISDTRPMTLKTQWAFVIYACIYSVAIGWLVHSIAKYMLHLIKQQEKTYREKVHMNRKNVYKIFTIIKYIMSIILLIMAFNTTKNIIQVVVCSMELLLIFILSQCILKHNKIIGNVFHNVFIFIYCLQMGILIFGNSYLTRIMLSNLNSFEALAEDFKLYIILIVAMVVVCILPVCYIDIKAKIYNFKCLIPAVLVIYLFCIIFCGKQFSPVYSMFDLCMQEIEYRKMQQGVEIENVEEEFFGVVEDNRKKDNVLPTKPNIIIIFTEGMSQYIIEDERNITPNIRKFMNNSLSFSNYFNHTFATYHGLQGQLYSGYSLNDLDTNSLVSLQDVLHDNGYYTMFINVEPHNTDFTNYLSSFEYDELVTLEGEEYLGYNDTMSDEQAYDFLYEKAVNLSKKDEPFLITIYTFGTHMNMDSTDKKFEDGSNRVLNRFYNMDYEFGEFFDKILDSNLKENTIIIFTTDHATYVDKDLLDSGLKYVTTASLNRIPLFIWYDGIEPETVDVNGRNSLSFAPTVLDYLDINADAYFMGDSLFAEDTDNMYDNYYFDGSAYLSSENAVVGEIPSDELDIFKE